MWSPPREPNLSEQISTDFFKAFDLSQGKQKDVMAGIKRLMVQAGLLYRNATLTNAMASEVFELVTKIAKNNAYRMLGMNGSKYRNLGRKQIIPILQKHFAKKGPDKASTEVWSPPKEPSLSEHISKRFFEALDPSRRKQKDAAAGIKQLMVQAGLLNKNAKLTNDTASEVFELVAKILKDDPHGNIEKDVKEHQAFAKEHVIPMVREHFEASKT